LEGFNALRLSPLCFSFLGFNVRRDACVGALNCFYLLTQRIKGNRLDFLRLEIT